MRFLFSPNGRIGRLAWWGGEFVPVLAVILGVVLIGETIGESYYTSPPAARATAILTLVAMPVLSMWINICLTVKRFHDRGKSGVWFLIVFVPVIGGLWQIVECGFLPGDAGPNEYGPPGGGFSGSLDAEIGALREKSRAAASFAPPSAAVQPAATVVARPYRPRGGSVPATGGFGRRGA